MKNLKKIAPPIGVIVILLAATALRIVLPSIPYDSGILLTFRFLINICSEEWFGSSWAVWDLMVVFIALCCAICLPAEGKYRKLQRFVVAPLVILLVSALVTPFVNATTQKAYDDYRAYQKQQEKERLDQTYRDIEAFLEDADVAFAYNLHSQSHDQRFEEAFPELVLTHPYLDGEVEKIGHHHCDYVLIDYDTQRVGVIYDDTLLEFYEFQLRSADQYPSTVKPTALELDGPGAQLAFYSTGESLSQYTACISLTMADGRIYSISGLSDERNFYIGLQNTTYQRIEDFPAP